ncbi:MAG: 3-oxoacyl-ACP synthase, partial [Bacteroidia bacterium]|nr:3-oxoacyl-ACP synthase [Bacteroidia bacterium]
MKRAAITAVNAWLPDYVLTNQELEKMVDTSDEWIITRTGIKERRILKGEKATSDMAAEAIKGLLEKKNLKPEDIECVIVATTTPDLQFPATATITCDKVGIKNVLSYDINAACSGFLFALITAS